jgi:hypothetical protein
MIYPLATIQSRTGGDPAAACPSRKERIQTTGPPVALCRLTTHDDSDGQVSFVCRLVPVVVGVRGSVRLLGP